MTLDASVVIALASFLGTTVGSIFGILRANKLTNYRIEQLEKKVEQHNNVIGRTSILETKMEACEKAIESIGDEL